MRYWGGKTRVAKDVCKALEAVTDGHELYWEPFAGGLSIFSAFAFQGPRFATDLNPALETLYTAWTGGWRPTMDDITEEQWRHYEATQDPLDPMTALVGHGCSFGGKWFKSYARITKRSHRPSDFDKGRVSLLSSGVRSLDRKFKAMEQGGDVTFGTIDALQVRPEDLPPNTLIYCDPPYQDSTMGYGIPCQTPDFWPWFRSMATLHTLVVSEYEGPSDWPSVQVCRRGGQSSFATRTERLFLSPGIDFHEFSKRFNA